MGMVDGRPLPQRRAIRVECREYQNGVEEGRSRCLYCCVRYLGGREREKCL